MGRRPRHILYQFAVDVLHDITNALLLHVERSLKTAQPTDLQPMYGGLPDRLKAVYRDWLSTLYDEYFRTRKKEVALRWGGPTDQVGDLKRRSREAEFPQLP